MRLKGLLSTLAPTVGKAIGGPMGGMAIKMVADKLGISNTTNPVKLEKYLEEHPEAIGLLQEAEAEFAQTVEDRKIDLDNFKVDSPDRQSARELFGEDPTPKIFAIISLMGFLAYIFLVTFRAEAVDDALANIILGYLGGLISGISAFFFGSSNNRSS
tara:strand:- start:56 stop:529 length:474 start_codon:yes stop_codon:yes gene_type:complete